MVAVRVPLTSRRIRYALVAIVAAVILVGSVLKPDTTAAPTTGPLGIVGADKWTHAIAYAGLAATVAYASVVSNRDGDDDRLILAVVLAVGFGIGVEFVQWPIPYRTAGVADALVDAVGACVLALGWWSASRFVRFVPLARWRSSSG